MHGLRSDATSRRIKLTLVCLGVKAPNGQRRLGSQVSLRRLPAPLPYDAGMKRLSKHARGTFQSLRALTIPTCHNIHCDRAESNEAKIQFRLQNLSTDSGPTVPYNNIENGGGFLVRPR
jgi:hypothetical protein